MKYGSFFSYLVFEIDKMCIILHLQHISFGLAAFQGLLGPHVTSNFRTAQHPPVVEETASQLGIFKSAGELGVMSDGILAVFNGERYRGPARPLTII